MKLTARDYKGSEYYEEHKQAGLDYLNCGLWQHHYAAMVCQAIRPGKAMLDIGCACGSILNGFRETGRFTQLVGIDLSDHMTDLGRDKYGLDLRVCDAAQMPFEANQFDFVHSANVFEHISEGHIYRVLKQIGRVLRPDGKAFICLDALSEGQDKADYMHDPTHINIRPISYWDNVFFTAGFVMDTESLGRFYMTQMGPGDTGPTFPQTYPNWRVFCLANQK